MKEKLSLFCHVPVMKFSWLLVNDYFQQLIALVANELLWSSQVANIFTLYDVSNIWRVPLLLRVNSFLIHQTKIFTLALC